MYGTVALLDAADQRLVAGFVVNKFRGDETLLKPGLDRLEQITGRPVHGVLPWSPDVWLDSEDALELDQRWSMDAGSLRVAVIRLPRISNFTDVVPSASNRASTSPSWPIRADWPMPTSSCFPAPARRSPTWPGCALADSTSPSSTTWTPGARCSASAADSRCSAEPSATRTASRACVGRRPRPGLLDVKTVFTSDKVLRRHEDGAYEIDHGRVTHAYVEEGGLVSDGLVSGSMRHGSLESDEFRRGFLTAAAKMVGRELPASTSSFAQARARRLDLLGDSPTSNSTSTRCSRSRGTVPRMFLCSHPARGAS